MGKGAAIGKGDDCPKCGRLMTVFKRKMRPPASSQKGWYAQWQRCLRCHHIQHSMEHYHRPRVMSSAAQESMSLSDVWLVDDHICVFVFETDNFKLFERAGEDPVPITVGRNFPDQPRRITNATDAVSERGNTFQTR